MQRTLKRLDSVHEKLVATITPLAPEIFSRRPSESEWSVSEILHHLCLVEDRVIKELEKELAGSPQRLGVLRRLVPTSIVGSRLIKVKAPRAMNPVEPPAKEISLGNYDEARGKLKTLCETHGRARLQQTVFKHPILGRITGVAAVSFLGYHEQRHLKQVLEVLTKLK
ncbi:MAG TPA: DinB family protein [Pyrinomonadaceae bacterium]|nr:DinB family protein [Pyrinomonadaceae bacterium]